MNGEPVDRPPVSLWKHFPNEDQSAKDLAEATLRWQAMLDLDFIKLMPPGDYATIDWGAASEYQGASGGTRQTIRYPVQSAVDWDHIRPLDVSTGFNAEVIETCGLVRRALGPDIAILQTIFSPLTIANKLSGGLVLTHLREQPERVHAALRVITDVTVQLTRQSLKAGADGVFFASQCATSDLTTRAEYAEFGTGYDLPVIAAAREGGSEFTLVHVHGPNTYFDVLAGYGGDALNWHDRRTGPSITEVLRRYPDQAPVAGIDEHAISTMTAEEVRAQVADARNPAGDRRLMIAPGCVILIETPEENLRAAVQAAKETNSGQDDQVLGGP